MEPHQRQFMNRNNFRRSGHRNVHYRSNVIRVTQNGYAINVREEKENQNLNSVTSAGTLKISQFKNHKPGLSLQNASQYNFQNESLSDLKKQPMPKIGMKYLNGQNSIDRMPQFQKLQLKTNLGQREESASSNSIFGKITGSALSNAQSVTQMERGTNHRKTSFPMIESTSLENIVNFVGLQELDVNQAQSIKNGSFSSIRRKRSLNTLIQHRMTSKSQLPEIKIEGKIATKFNKKVVNQPERSIEDLLAINNKNNIVILSKVANDIPNRNSQKDTQPMSPHNQTKDVLEEFHQNRTRLQETLKLHDALNLQNS